MSNGWSFELDDQQVAKLAAWRAEQDKAVLERQRAASTGEPFVDAVHESGSPYYGAVGGELTISFCPTSIGTIVTATHSSGAEINLTDYENW
jgi:hypothetical protein